MAKKRIRCICHGPIAAGPQYQSPWEDVWLRWKGKPGRKKYYAAPTLVCSAEIPVELESHEQIRNREDVPPIAGLEFSPTTKEERASWYREDDERLRAAQEALKTQPYHIDPTWIQGRHLETIYTNAKGIDRAEAERMLTFYLREVFGVKNPKFQWDRPRIIVQPIGFGVYS